MLVIGTKAVCSYCISCNRATRSFIGGITIGFVRKMVVFVGVVVAFGFRIEVRTNMEDQPIMEVIIYFNSNFHRDLIGLIKVIIIVINFSSVMGLQS